MLTRRSRGPCHSTSSQTAGCAGTSGPSVESAHRARGSSRQHADEAQRHENGSECARARAGSIALRSRRAASLARRLRADLFPIMRAATAAFRVWRARTPLIGRRCPLPRTAFFMPLRWFLYDWLCAVWLVDFAMAACVCRKARERHAQRVWGANRGSRIRRLGRFDGAWSARAGAKTGACMCGSGAKHCACHEAVV